MKKFFLFFASTLYLFLGTGCKNDGGSVHKHGKGATPKLDDIVTFDFALHKDTSLVFNSVTSGRAAQETITDPSNSDDPFFKFLMKNLMTMREGDSTSFNFKLDTMKTPPPGLAGGKQAILSIALRKVQTEKDFLASLPTEQQKQFMMQKKQTEVQKRVSKLKPEMDAAQKDIVAASETFKLRSKPVADSTAAFAKKFSTNALGSEAKTTPSGLKYIILKEGYNAPVQQKQVVWVNYSGYTKDGKPFDESYKNGQPFVFAVGIGQVIPAWDEALTLFKPGTTAVIFVPSTLGYGERGSGNGTIPPNADLVFYIEVLKVI